MCIHTSPTAIHSDTQIMLSNGTSYCYIDIPYLYYLGYSLTHGALIYSYYCNIKIGTLAARSYLFLMVKNSSLE